MERARDLARAEERRRWEKRRVARCVEATVAGSRPTDELGGDARECRRGVIGGASEGPVYGLDTTTNREKGHTSTFCREHSLQDRQSHFILSDKVLETNQ
jgi:hypothetical protein